MALIASLLVPGVSIPQPDNSWLSGIADSIGGAIKNVRVDRSFNGLADRIQGTTPAQQPAGGFLTGLMGKVAGNAPMPLPSAASEIAATSPKVAASGSGNVYDDFIGGVKSAGLTNPYGLAAVAATGQAESGWSPQNANRSWSDPSQSGQAGTAGGVMSWRNERLNNLYNFARQRGEEPGNISPATQAAFFVQEDPKLIRSLNSAQSPEEAQRLMNNAWKFAGYDQPGGETARRMGLASSYVSRFQGAPTEVASLDPSAGMSSTAAPAAQAIETAAPASGYIDPMVKVEPRADAAPYTIASATAPQPQTQAQAQAANAQTSRTGMIAQGITPVQRGSVDPGLIQYMLRDRNLRDVGLKLWAANVEGQKASEPWQFVTLPDGTLARANQQSGAIEAVGRFPKDPKAEGLGGSEAGLNLVYGEDADGNTVAFQPLKGGGVRRVEVPDGIKLTPGISSNDLGTTVVTRNSRTGQVIDTRDKDVAGAAEQTADGKARSEAKAALPAIQSASDQMLATIDSLANDAYLPSMLGPINSRTPNLTSDAARVQSKMDQINGQTFLQAFNALKGGGAITEIEGQKATEAMARLNTAQSVEDYQAALTELRGVVTRGIANARAKAKGSTATTGSQTSSGVKWSIEE
ncbi:phage tail tip lysozyme [Agrobacterium tumefaciens]|uniref:phage tail tip lysozyme n=1 Tax=Agrobacterium tumefaciens TaxID=358 RepID=UPI003BA3C93B